MTPKARTKIPADIEGFEKREDYLFRALIREIATFGPDAEVSTGDGRISYHWHNSISGNELMLKI